MRKSMSLGSICVLLMFAVLSLVVVYGCSDNTSDARQQEDQEILLGQATSEVGMPTIKNFRERKLYREIMELRDDVKLTTYTYVFSEMTGKYTFLGESIGFGIPYSAQFTSPQKVEYRRGSIVTMPQADPNGLFAPESAEGTWILLRDPAGKEAMPVYIESRITVSPFKLPDSIVINP